jgi:enoyl-CoA hydratase/carnithine racemase
LEVLLGCNDLSAGLAERYGYINRALPADELTSFVEKLARRIASFPAHAIAHAKVAVDTIGDAGMPISPSAGEIGRVLTATSLRRAITAGISRPVTR